MKISYAAKYDVLYIGFRAGQTQVTTRHLSGGDIAIDLDQTGHLVRIEVLSASTHLDLREILPVEIAQP